MGSALPLSIAYKNNQISAMNALKYNQKQSLQAYSTPTTRHDLYYWHRQAPGSNAELDYLMGCDQMVVPIEVKSGRGSQLQSLRRFLSTRPKSKYGIRFSTHDFSVYEDLYSYPIYAVANACGVDITFLLNDE